MSGGALLILTPALPLALALFAGFMRHPLWLFPWAALPGLAAALFVPHGEAAGAPLLLLGMTLALDRIGAVFLGFGSLLWLLAGVYARTYLAGTSRAQRFAAFWLITLGGTLGTFIAADAVTFYTAFAVMSLTATVLVLHAGTSPARRAALIYLVLAVFAEACLLGGLVLAAADAESLLISDVRAALAVSPWRDYALAALIAGFGLKAGLIPLHVWLPLAHPVAPTPASAVLSGIIVKAAIIGLIRFLPLDGSLPAWGAALTAVGLATAYYGVFAGLAQRNAKTILAYSTLSQMGIVVAVLGFGLGAAEAAGAASAAAVYASHHALAKGALFLGVGVVAASGARARRPVLAVTALTALALAGLPASAGAAAKLAIAAPLGVGPAAALASGAAAGTGLLMLRFLFVVAHEGAEPQAVAPRGLLVPWAAATAAAFAVPFMLLPMFTEIPRGAVLAPGNLWDALMPLLAAGAVAAAALRILRSPNGLRMARRLGAAIPEGDLVVLGEAMVRRVARGYRATWPLLAAHVRAAERRPAVSLAAVEWTERNLARTIALGSALAGVAILLGLALAA